ncbi:MAG: hypothetical protein IJH39_11315 [Clostridia bacterium]|nr:hypothetical protein [Clostridia bacterium]
MKWSIESEQDKRIFNVIKDVKDGDYMGAMDAWGTYLNENLKFPFEAVVEENEVYYPIEFGDKLKVKSISMIDDLYGVIVNVQKGKHNCTIELCQLEASDENKQLLDDYNMWFSNM